MRNINLNREWIFIDGKFNYLHWNDAENKEKYKTVNLPHDFMIEGDVKEDALAGPAMGYYVGGMGSYTKIIDIPKEYEDEIVYLYFDGVMGLSNVEVNGAMIKNHHYGYTPFFVDITEYLDFGEENRITVNVNATMQPSSRWYAGAGIYRDVTLIHVPKIHVKCDGVYVHTERVAYERDEAKYAFVVAEAEVCNYTGKRKIVEAEVTITERDNKENVTVRSEQICINAGKTGKARIRMTIKNPKLWDDAEPNMYDVKVTVTEVGTFSTHLIAAAEPMRDEYETTFGIRTISADSTYGLLINNKPVILKGGCVHHDNGIMGAVSMYDNEYRKLKIHKENGFNAIRCAHNPPSAHMLKACDELGLYVMDEAFDCFETPKNLGDYGQFFNNEWKDDIEAFMKRDINHPSIIMWSTGNEIPDRGGLGNGFELATMLSEYMRSVDNTRLVTNAFCSFWGGLCDKEQVDNPSFKDDVYMEKRSEPFVNNLDIVGYNYLDEQYVYTAKNYPERVIIGTESFPKCIDTVWENVMKYPFVIGDFTWTSYDYIGEAGLGKSIFYDKDDEEAKKQAAKDVWSEQSQYPWRLSKDADFDINGVITPQGTYRKVVWGSDETFLYTASPDTYGLEEEVSLWGFNYVYPCYTYEGYEGKSLKVQVYTRAATAVLYLNDEEVARSEVSKETHYMANFDITYKPGKLVAVSLDECGNEISRAELATTGKASGIELVAEKDEIKADGNSLVYVEVRVVDNNGNIVYNTDVHMKAEVCGAGVLQAFGSANPITEENYTKGEFSSYQGRCMAVVRSGYDKGIITLKVTADGYADNTIEINVK